MAANADPFELRATVARMSARVAHRGPDGEGTWVDSSGDTVLAHRRLSVIDLSEAGAQPMHSANRRWVVTYNGELYNTARLRTRLGSAAQALRGHSDTEVLVEVIARFGFPAAIEQLDGMFAVAAWDRERRELWLARDRFGEKPLYYTEQPGRFAFASELPAIEGALRRTPDIDRVAVGSLLRHYYVSAPRTIYDGVHQLEAGSWLVVRDAVPSDPVRYWNPVLAAADVKVRERTIEDSVDELEELLKATICSRLESDVPLGAFLSGGVDSGTIVALMQQINGNTKTFTVGFDDSSLDESSVARQVARILGTEHEEQIVTGSDALAVVSKLARIYGEPFADSSQIPTTLMCQHASRRVSVALSGDAGDELFGGYERYRYFEKLLRVERVPRSIRKTAATTLDAVPARALQGIVDSRLGRVVPAALRNRPTTRTRKLAQMLRSADEPELYRTLRSVVDDPWTYIVGDPLSSEAVSLPSGRLTGTRLAMMVDTLDYLPNDILTKVDRAAMSVSLETRVPFLDPEIFRFAWSLPTDHLVQDGVGKQVLRKLLRRYVPEEITSLPKRGFGVPLDDWLRGPLSKWAGDLLDPALIAEGGVLEPGAVASLWRRHQTAQENLGPQLWPIIMFQSWSHDR